MNGTMTVVDEFGTELQVGPAPGKDDQDLMRLMVGDDTGGVCAHLPRAEFRRFAATLLAMTDRP